MGGRREEIVGRLRRFGTAAVLLHHAVAERLALGPTDLTCLDLLRERGPLIGRDLAAATGLTSGAVTGVVARLERAGWLRREPDPHDHRAQRLSAEPARARDLEAALGPVRVDATTLLHGFDDAQLAAVAEFLARAADLTYRRAATLRAQAALAPRDAPPRHAPPPDAQRPNAPRAAGAGPSAARPTAAAPTAAAPTAAAPTEAARRSRR